MTSTRVVTSSSPLGMVCRHNAANADQDSHDHRYDRQDPNTRGQNNQQEQAPSFLLLRLIGAVAGGTKNAGSGR